MDTKKSLVSSIITFLRSELEGNQLDEDAKEGLGVSIECLEQAYKFDSVEASSSVNLLAIYEEYNKKLRAASEESRKAAEEQKQKGNNLMKEEKYEDAISCYTNAIDLDNRNAVYFCNRAAAYTKLEKNILAIEDCNKAVQIDPNYGKAYGRMGLAYLNEKNYNKAAENYEKALQMEPTNASYQTNLSMAKEKIAEQQQQQQQPSAANPLAGMDLSSLLNNPAVMNMAQNFMQNPAMQNMFANMMGNMGGGGGPPPPSGRLDGNTAPGAGEGTDSVSGAAAQGGNPGFEGFQMPQGLDFSNILSATQQVADQLRTQNPEMAESLRSQFQQGQQQPQQPPPDDTDKKE